MSLNQLLKDQQRIVAVGTPSLGYLVGEGVAKARVINTPGLIGASAMEKARKLFLSYEGVNVRGVALNNSTFFANTLAGTQTFEGISTTELTEQEYFLTHPVVGEDIANNKITINPSFLLFSGVGTPKIIVNLQAFRLEERFVIDDPSPSVWRLIPPIGTDWGSYRPLVRNNDLITDFRDLSPLFNAASAFNSLGLDDVAGFATWARTYHYNFSGDFTGATRRLLTENVPAGDRPSARLAYFLSDLLTLTFDSSRGLLYNTSPVMLANDTYMADNLWDPNNTARAVPNVDVSVKLYGDASAPLKTFRQSLLNETGLQSFEIDLDGATRAKRIEIEVLDNLEGNPQGVYLDWVSSVYYALPRTFRDRTAKGWRYETTLDIDTISIFASGAELNIPTIATVSGTRPNEYLTFSNAAWTGTFKKGRTRCPAWALYHVLTDARYLLNLPPARIDAQSFLEASRYCQALVAGKPRWSYDGLLQGSQSAIIGDLLRCCRGWLITDHQARLALRLERPSSTTWIVCPAVAVNGNINYRDALPRPQVRATYTDRATGQEAVTPGLSNTRFEEVPWQDQATVERWADWQSFQEQNLLGTVEVQLAWAAHRVAVGDLLSVHDPILAGVRTAGRIVTGTTDWVTLDLVPLELWPTETAGAMLIPLAAETWGWVGFNGPANTRLELQAPLGGVVQATVRRIEFKVGVPGANRVWFTTPLAEVPEDRTTWAMEFPTVYPTRWRVESVTETTDGRTFGVSATRYIDGMHSHVETGAALPARPHRWGPVCGTRLSQFQGAFTELNDRYPVHVTDVAKRWSEWTVPWDDQNGVFTNLTTSCR